MIYRRKFIMYENGGIYGDKISFINDDIYLHFKYRDKTYIRKLYKGSKNYYFQFRGNKILVPKEEKK